ncbi:MAG: hypothetical protein RQM92_06015 [Candidatus Syntrophopropionicum ammoniitolerans]
MLPEGLAFAYHFTFLAKFDDVEHVHILSPAGGKLPGTKLPKVVDGSVNPFKRTILFQPRLVLYLNKPEWAGSFHSPRYPVVLGRSQDLFTYTRVSRVKLVSAGGAYFEHTLAAYRMALQTGRGYGVLMPRFLDYTRGRIPTFDRYVVLSRRVYTEDFIRYQKQPVEKYWVDPESTVEKGAGLGLLFHTFVGDDDDQPLVAGLVG